MKLIPFEKYIHATRFNFSNVAAALNEHPCQFTSIPKENGKLPVQIH
jgi:hypothetical protein